MAIKWHFSINLEGKIYFKETVMEKTVVIGCGLIGQSWAVIFAQSGLDVVMYDSSSEAIEKVIVSIEKKISDLVEFDLISREDAPKILERVKVERRLEDALKDASYIQECGPEQLDLKQKITQSIDSIADRGVPIGSSTSGISASKYSANISGRDRCLVVHPINPPHLIPAVEIVPSAWTDEAIVKKVVKLMEKCNRETILLSKEIDGFIVNRLQGALLEEAFRLIGSRVVSAGDLDKAISHGLGMRWSFMGPMKTIHLNAPGGVSQYVERYGEMYRKFGIGGYESVNWKDVAEEMLNDELCEQVPIKGISEAQNQRDRKLMALLRHKKSNVV